MWEIVLYDRLCSSLCFLELGGLLIFYTVAFFQDSTNYFCNKHFGICIYVMNESKQPYSFDLEGFDMREVHVLKK